MPRPRKRTFLYKYIFQFNEENFSHFDAAVEASESFFSTFEDEEKFSSIQISTNFSFYQGIEDL